MLFASGYIAGGAIAGIVIAFLAGVLSDFDATLQQLGHGPQSVLRGTVVGRAVPDPFRRHLPHPFPGLARQAARDQARGMKDSREEILGRVRAALNPLAERAAYPEYAADVAVMKQLFAEGRDLWLVFSERLAAVNGIALGDPGALVAWLLKRGHLHGYCDPALWPKLTPHFNDSFKVETTFDRSRVDDYSFGITRAAGGNRRNRDGHPAGRRDVAPPRRAHAVGARRARAARENVRDQSRRRWWNWATIRTRFG